MSGLQNVNKVMRFLKLDIFSRNVQEMYLLNIITSCLWAQFTGKQRIVTKVIMPYGQFRTTSKLPHLSQVSIPVTIHCRSPTSPPVIYWNVHGMSPPLSPVCSKYLQMHQDQRDRLYEVEAPGGWGQRRNIWLNIQLNRSTNSEALPRFGSGCTNAKVVW